MQHLQPTSTLQGGKYQIVRFLSSGGFGNTYEGVHTMMDTRVAIKEFFPKMFCNRDENTSHVTVATQGNRELVDKLRKKFNEEAKAVFQMNHPNIVRVLDIFEENGTAYYVMEFIDGKSLNDITKERGALPEAEAVGYIRQVADALKYVHSLNRLHLDIKPGNIMVDKNGKAILIDFGASKHYDTETGENTSTLMGVNTTGYAPAEQTYRGFVQFFASTDIYALGATLYKLLTGITPPDAQMLKDGEAELAPLPSGVSDSVKSAIKESMRPLRKDRPQSVGEFVAMLSEKQSISSNNKTSYSLDVPKNVAVDEETIIDSNNKPRAKSPKYQKSDLEIKDEAWDIAKKYSLGFREYNEEYEGSLNEVSYCRMVIRDKSLIMRRNQRLYQDYNADAQKLYKKYGEVVRFEDCKKILMEEKGNFAIAEQRVAKWFVNVKGAKPATNEYYAEYTKYVVSLLLGAGSILIGLYFIVIGMLKGAIKANDTLQALEYSRIAIVAISLCCFIQFIMSKKKSLNIWAFVSSLALLLLEFPQVPFFASYLLCGNYVTCALMYAIRTDTWKVPSVLGLLYFITMVFIHIFS